MIGQFRLCERRSVMAETKKTVSVTPAAKAVAAKAADTKTVEAKTAPAASVAAPQQEAKKEEPKKAPAKKAAAKKTAAKKAPAKKAAAAKKTTAKTTTKAAKAPAKKAVKAAMTLQFAGKEYTTDDLVKIAKEVWKHDLNRKVGDFKSVELYVKPEESKVYYVINGEVAGDFAI